MKPFTRFATLASLSLVFLACGPSIDPAAKADIDRRIAALGAPKQTVSAPSALVPLPFAAGQWTRHKLVDDKGQPSFMTYKILSQESDAFWIEVVTEAYTGRTMMKMLLAVPNRMDPNSIEIRAVSMKDKEGRVTNFDGFVLSAMQGTYKSMVSSIAVTWQGMPQEDATSPAGKFAGCYKGRSDASWGPFHSASMSWSHSAVPISGLIKSNGIDKPNTIELVDFGLTGAVSEF